MTGALLRTIATNPYPWLMIGGFGFGWTAVLLVRRPSRAAEPLAMRTWRRLRLVLGCALVLLGAGGATTVGWSLVAGYPVVAGVIAAAAAIVAIPAGWWPARTALALAAVGSLVMAAGIAQWYALDAPEQLLAARELAVRAELRGGRWVDTRSDRPVALAAIDAEGAASRTDGAFRGEAASAVASTGSMDALAEAPVAIVRLVARDDDLAVVATPALASPLGVAAGERLRAAVRLEQRAPILWWYPPTAVEEVTLAVVDGDGVAGEPVAIGAAEVDGASGAGLSAAAARVGAGVLAWLERAVRGASAAARTEALLEVTYPASGRFIQPGVVEIVIRAAR